MNTHISLSFTFSFEILDCTEQFVEPYLLHTPSKEVFGPCLSLISTNAGYPGDFYQVESQTPVLLVTHRLKN